MSDKINARQLMLIVTLSRVSVPVLFLPVVTSADVYQDAWIAAIVQAVPACLTAAMAASLVAGFPGRSFAEIARALLGKVAGAALALLVATVLYALSVTRMRFMTLTLITEMMPRTPGWAMAIPALVVALYGAVLGTDSLGRAAELISVVVLGVILLGAVMLLVSGAGALDSLRPVLEGGIRPVLEASAVPAFFSATSASVVLALGKHAAKPGGLRGAMLWGILASTAVLVMLTVLVLIALGPRQARHELSPVLALAGTVFLKGVIERMDLFLIIVWTVGVVFDVTVLLLSSSILVGDALGLHPGYTAVGLFFLAVPLVSLRFTDIFMGRVIFSPPAAAAVTLVAHVFAVGVVYIAAALRRRRQGP